MSTDSSSPDADTEDSDVVETARSIIENPERSEPVKEIARAVIDVEEGNTDVSR